MPKTQVISAPPAVADEGWSRAIDVLQGAQTAEQRATAVVELLTALAAQLPGLARHRASILGLMRSSLAASSLVDTVAGDPCDVTDVVVLPTFEAADVAAEAVGIGQVRARVLESPLLSASAVSELLGSRSANPRQYANRLRAKGDLLAVPHQNQYLYPAFQVDPAKSRIMPGVPEINRVLDASADPWGVAAWWLEPNGRTGGSAPATLIARPDGPKVLLEIATDLTHGE